MMKKLLALIAALGVVLLCVFPAAAAVKYPLATNEFFVNDFANVLDADVEQQLLEQGSNLYYACKAQVVAVTIESLEGQDIESYSIGLARQWGIGDKDEDNGILLLVSVSDREARIEVGRGLEGALPDSKTGRIMDTYGIPYLRENDFSKGIAAVYDSIVNEIYIEYGLNPDEDYEPVGEDGIGFMEIITVIIFIIIGIGMFTRRGRGGRIPLFFFFGGPGRFSGNHHGGSGGFGGFSGGGGFHGGGGGFSGGGSSHKF